jgi:ubiquinone/menaquinone biosynthesis C-methylase UbiE
MHTNEGVHKILNISWIYDLLQMAAGSDRVYKKICSSINPEASVLDIGCGTATVVNYLPKNINYLGYDFSQHYIDTAKKNFHGKKI